MITAATVYVFFATWCVPCRQEMPEIARLDREWRDRGVEFVLVSEDAPSTAVNVPAFVAKYGLEARVVIDSDSALADRYNPTAALPFIAEPWQLIAAYLVMAFAWATMSLGAINTILGLWFEEKRGLAISLALNGASFGGVVIVPGLVLIAGAWGFEAAMLAGAALILTLMVPIALTILGAPLPSLRAAGPATEAPGGKGQEGGPAVAWTRRRALRSLAFWSVAAPFAIAITSQAGFLVHQIAFLETTIGRYPAGIAVAITTSMAIVGRLVLGLAVCRIDQRMASTLSLASQAAALAVMIQASDATTLFAACAVYGFSVGNVITFPSLIIQREFEAAAFGMLIGLATGIGQFTYAFGPGLLGLVRDATGSYGAALGLCITLNLAAAGMVLRRPQAAGSAAR